MREVAGVVLAGGSGLRFGGCEPKHFHLLGGMPIIIVALRTLAACRSVNWLLAVVSADYVEQTRGLLSEYEVEKKVDVIAGGVTRQDSSFNAIKALKGMLDERDIVVLHDAARPLTPADIIEESVASAIEYGAAVAAVRTSDTVAEVEDGSVVATPGRDRLWNMQTPQTFEFGLISDAHERARDEGFASATDDVGLLLRIGEKVRIVESGPSNIKITTQDDLAMAEIIYRERGE